MRVVEPTILMNQDVTESLHPPEGGTHLAGNHRSSGKLLEEVVLFPGKAQTEARHEQGADVDRAVDADLQETLASSSLFDALEVLFEPLRGNRPKLDQVAIDVVELGQDPVAVNHAPPRRDSGGDGA